MNVQQDTSIISGDLKVGDHLHVHSGHAAVGIGKSPAADSGKLQVAGSIVADTGVHANTVNSTIRYSLGNDIVLSGNTLGSTITSSGLTSVGTLTGLAVNGNTAVGTNVLLADTGLSKVGIKHTPLAGSSDFTVDGTATVTGALDIAELELPVAGPATNTAGKIYAGTNKLHFYDTSWKDISSDERPYAHYKQDTAQVIGHGAAGDIKWQSVTQRGGFALTASPNEHLISFPVTGLYYCAYTMAWGSNAAGDRQAWLEYQDHRHGLCMGGAGAQWDAFSASCVINVPNTTDTMKLYTWHSAGTNVSSFVWTTNPVLHPSVTIAWIGKAL